MISSIIFSLENIQKKIDFKSVSSIVVLALGVTFLSVNAFLAFKLGLWRHDAASELSTYYTHLRSEGRWVNYLMFNALHEIPPPFAWALNLILYLVFLYILFFRVTADLLVALGLAFAGVMLPSFHAQFMWPATLLAGPGLLALFFLFVNERNMPLMLVSFGVLLFGVMHSLVFVLALSWCIYYRRLDFKRFAYWFTCWVAGFFAGYVVANGLAWVVTGQVIQVADWRQPDRAQSLGELVSRVPNMVLLLWDHIFINFGARALGVMVALFLVGIYFVWTRREDKNTAIGLTLASLSTLAVGAAAYLQVIPLGVLFQFRTSLVAALAGLTFGALFFRVQNASKVQHLLILLFVAFVLLRGGDYGVRLKDAFIQTEAVLASVRSAIERENGLNTGSFKIIEIHSFSEQHWNLNQYINASIPVGAAPLNDAGRWGGVFKGAATSKFLDCQGPHDTRDRACEPTEDLLDKELCNNPLLGFCRTALTRDNTLIIFTR